MRPFNAALNCLAIAALTALSFVQAAPLEKRVYTYANDWSCKPTASKPYPLVLVHATFPTADVNWMYHGSRFVLKGYCVFQLDYGHVPQLPGIGGMGPIEDSAEELRVFVDKVLAATNTTQVDMMGHSQGGLMPIYYMKRLGGAAKVRKMGAIAPATHGTSLSGIVHLGRFLGLYDPVTQILNQFCAACMQMVYDSTFMKDLYSDGDRIEGPEFFMLATKYDEVVTPWQNSFLRDVGPGVTNVAIQDLCAVSAVMHIGMFGSPIAFNAMHNFFYPTGRSVNCLSFFT